MTLREQLSEEYDELCFMDGYDDCIAGIVTPCFLEVRK